MRLQKIATIVLLMNCCGWAGIMANSSFENPDVSGMLCGVSGLYGCAYQPVTANWAFTGSSGIASDIDASNPFNLGSTADGTQTGFIQWDTANPASHPGTMTQTLTGLVFGQSYVVSFQAAQRPDTLGPTGAFLFGGDQDFNVLWNDSVIGYFFPTSSSFSGYVTSFTATASTGTLAFLAVDTLLGDRTAFIDDVQIDAAVPEPSNGLMVLFAIGLIGVGLFRKLIYTRQLPS